MIILNSPKARNTKKLTSEQKQKMRERDNKMVEGIFRSEQGEVTFYIRRHKEDYPMKRTLKDGERATIPWMLADYIRNQCYTTTHKRLLDSQGKPIKVPGKKIHRHFFEPVSFGEREEENFNKKESK